jgi:hypothetical protein
MAACSAISRTRSATDSMIVAQTEVCELSIQRGRQT